MLEVEHDQYNRFGTRNGQHFIEAEKTYVVSISKTKQRRAMLILTNVQCEVGTAYQLPWSSE